MKNNKFLEVFKLFYSIIGISIGLITTVYSAIKLFGKNTK